MLVRPRLPGLLLCVRAMHGHGSGLFRVPPTARRMRAAIGAGAVAAASSIALVRWRQRLRISGVACSLWQYVRLRWRLRHASRLIIVSDFDRTVTTARVRGLTGLSCHGIIEHGPGLSKAYFEATQDLFKHYHAIEVSAAYSPSQKIPLMTEWYRKSHELMLREPVNPVGIRHTINDPETLLQLRPGVARLVGLGPPPPRAPRHFHSWTDQRGAGGSAAEARTTRGVPAHRGQHALFP